MYLFYQAKNLMSKYPLHDAIENNEIERLQYLLRNKIDINTYNAVGITPLQYSILKKKPEFTILLLENKANPNLSYNCTKYAKVTDIPLQVYINKEDISNIKILALYGASTVGIKFDTGKQYLERIIIDCNEIYRIKKSIEQKIENKGDFTNEDYGNCHKIAEMLSTLSNEEDNPSYKSHYKQLSDKFLSLSKRLHNSTELELMPTSDTKSILRQRK